MSPIRQTGQAPPSAARRPEIDQHTIKLTVGAIAIFLGPLTCSFAPAPLTSISAAYYAGGWSQSIFIGFLFATAAFLLAYNGYTTAEMLLSKLAAVAALGVALFPCYCADHPELVLNVHAVSATIMFLTLIYFCYCFYTRARGKQHSRARLRAHIYVLCGLAIFFSLLTLGIDRLTGGLIRRIDQRLIFHGEFVGLLAFGISWLTASRMLPGLTRRDERLSLFR